MPESLSPVLCSRRHALMLLAGGLAPSVAFGQTATPVPPATPAIPAIPATLPAVDAAPPAPKPAAALPSKIDASKAYYLFFDQAIDVASMRTMRGQLAELVEAGVKEITIVIDSPGGMVEPTLITYSFTRSLPARIDTHAQGFVASAANVLFLAGERRSADRNIRFLFHPSRFGAGEYLSEQQMRDRINLAEAFSAEVTDLYHDRTRLTDQQVASFDQGEVLFNADQALAAGIIQTIGDLKLPGQNARIMFSG